MILKAGTYRFNDVLTLPNFEWNGYIINNAQFRGTCSTNINVGSDIETYNQFVGFDFYEEGSLSLTLYHDEFIGIPVYDEDEFHNNFDKVLILNEDFELTDYVAEADMTIEGYAQFLYDTFVSNTNYNEVNATPLATIEYNGSTIAELNAGDKTTIPCSQYKMSKDLVVKVNEVEGGTGESTGLELNGIIEQYKVNAGATVNAGDFVEFINKVGNGGFTDHTVSELIACKLDNTRIALCYIDNGDSSNDKVVILKFTNDDIFIGTPSYISSGTPNKSMCALSDNSIIIVTDRGADNGYAMLYSVDDISITYVTSEILPSSSSTGSASSLDSSGVIALSNNKALVVYKANRVIGAVVLTTDGTTISFASAKTIVNDYTSFGIGLCPLTNNKVIFWFAVGYDSVKLYVISIDGTTVSIGTPTSVFSTINKDYFSLVKLNDENILFVGNNYGKSNYGAAQLLNISGTTINKLTYFEFTDYAIEYCKAVTLSENKVLVTYSIADTNSTSIILSINNNTISSSSSVAFDSTPSKSFVPLAFSSSSVIVLYANTTGNYIGLNIDGTTISVINETEESRIFVQPATSRLHNIGVAKTSGAEGKTVDVYCVG